MYSHTGLVLRLDFVSIPGMEVNKNRRFQSINLAGPYLASELVVKCVSRTVNTGNAGGTWSTAWLGPGSAGTLSQGKVGG